MRDVTGKVGRECDHPRELVGASVLLALLFLAHPSAADAQEVAGADGADGKPAATIVVEMQDFAFSPSRIEVEHGDVVRFVQVSQSPHNVEFRDVPEGTRLGPADANPISGSGVTIHEGGPPVIGPFLMQKGSSYEIVIDESFANGLHEFVCTPHEALGMKGTLVVRDVGAVTPAASGSR